MRQPFERLLVGKRLAGRYELAEAIGAGGMSLVFRGTDTVLGRPVAVKVVSLPADSEEVRENLRERFRREAGSAARIAHHPNVVQVYDYGTDAELDLDFIVMELLRGRDLKEALKQGRIPRGQALRILGEAARGLAAGHEQGIVHRDVKPANVFLVGDDGRVDYVRILDFGIAKPMEPGDDESLTLTGLGQLPHSPAYASPEQLDPDAPVTPASDVYQLGLIGYELLTGERPYADPERQRIRGGEEVGPPESAAWRAVDPPLRAVIARALRRDPAARYPDAGAFADALAAADGDAPDEDEEATVFIPTPSPVPAVVPAAGAAVPSPTPPVPAMPVEPVSAEPLSLPSPAVRGRRFKPAAWGIPVVLLLLALAVWGVRRRPTTASPGSVAADTGAIADLNDKFLRLEGEVAGGVPDSAADTARADTATAAATVPETESTDQRRAAEVQAAVIDMHAAWSAGDLDRVMSHYADRVDYFGVEGASKAFVRRSVGATVERYQRRIITIDSQATMFERPDLARTLVTKEWDFSGRGERWTGSMRQELVLRRAGGAWLIVSEKSQKIFRQNRSRQ
jgi:serine/threonine protein kinase/ketosteroid isomerase-like protein